MAYQMLQDNGYPLTCVGYRRFAGFQEGEILTVIAELSKTKVGSVRQVRNRPARFLKFKVSAHGPTPWAVTQWMIDLSA